jgi:hypothetical protein
MAPEDSSISFSPSTINLLPALKATRWLISRRPSQTQDAAADQGSTAKRFVSRIWLGS